MVLHVLSSELRVVRDGTSLAEYDGAQIASTSISLLQDIISTSKTSIEGVAISTQRATSVIWDRSSGEPLGPVLSWQDLRTSGTCLSLAAQGYRLSPSESATKFSYLLGQLNKAQLSNALLGTLDAYLIYVLSGGRSHVTDASNVAMTGLTGPDANSYDQTLLSLLQIPTSALGMIVNTHGELAIARRLRGQPPILASIGDQQASSLGQGVVGGGLAKLTLGTGGMMDLNLGASRPNFERKGPNGTYPVVMWRDDNTTQWGLEGIILSAGSALAWFCETMAPGVTLKETSERASQAQASDTTVFVPALEGLGTPTWDLGARGTFLGISRSTGVGELARAVIDGICHQSADLLDALERDGDLEVSDIRLDGKMSENAYLVQSLADKLGVPVHLSSPECTTIGAALLGFSVLLGSPAEALSQKFRPTASVLPKYPRRSARHEATRQRWRECVEVAKGQIPALSLVQF